MQRLIRPMLSLFLVVLCAGQVCSPTPPPPAPGPSASDTPGCSNTCQFAFDGVCDDGGPGSTWSVCDSGTDCNDCGERDVSGGGSDDTGGGGSSCDSCVDNGDWGTPVTIWGLSIDEMFVGRESLSGIEGGVCATADNHWCQSNLDPKFGIRGLWGSSSTNVYGVGFDTSADVGTWGAIVHFDGTQWTKILKASGMYLNAIWGSGPNDIFVGGDDNRIIHYDGNQWMYQETGLPSSVGPSFDGIWGTAYNNVWAVGNRGLSGEGVIYHYDGSSWSEVTSAAAWLSDIWGTAADDIFAVGLPGSYSGANAGPPVILHYDGTRWNEMQAPDGVNVTLNAVHGTSSSNVWAVGEEGTLLHYDGSRWQKFDSQVTQSLFGVYTPSLNKLFVVGLVRGSATGQGIVKELNYNP